MTQELVDFVMERNELATLDPPERRLVLRQLLFDRFGNEGASAAGPIADLIDGYGPITDAMRDPGVTDVLINGPHEIWIERCGRLERSSKTFADRAALSSFVERLIGACGGRIDMSSPIADARLTDGSRLHAVLPPLAPQGPLVSIRRFPSVSFTLDDLTRFEMLSREQAELLRAGVRDRRSIVIGGGTGTGKTTLLNALLGEVPVSERVVVIEETPELRPRCGHSVSLVSRSSNVEGKGRIELQDLLRAALRMRPDRIVVGEVRGPEALVALDAMSTGHDGSFVTVHARSCSEVVDRMISLAMQGGAGDESSLRARFTRAFDLSVHLTRRDGKRVVESIEEIT